MAKRRARKGRKFTYGGRRIERPEEIGFWANILGTCALWGVLGLFALCYAVAVVAVVVGILFGGGYVFSKFGWI